MRKESNDAKLYLSSIPRVRLKWVWLQAEQSKVWSRLSSHFQPFLFLIAHILTIFDKKCILWPSLAHYCSLISRRQPLIGSQGPCSALTADATMTHFIPLMWYTGISCCGGKGSANTGVANTGEVGESN